MSIENQVLYGRNNSWYKNHESDAVLVFVHGVLSDSQDCWLARDNASGTVAYWPALIASDARFKNVGLYLGGYHTGISSGDFPIQQCAVELFSYLKTKDSSDRPPVMSKKKITFVCHSMGGIVARYLLCEYKDDFKDKDIGIVLVASPSYGSKLQHSLRHIIYLYNHKQGKQLRWENDTLKDLDARFKNLIDGNKRKTLHGVEFFENHFIIRSKWLPWFSRSKVVANESAARYFGYAKMVGGSDHMSICKPLTVEDTVHQFLLEFLIDKNLLCAQEAAVSEIHGGSAFKISDNNKSVVMAPSSNPPASNHASMAQSPVSLSQKPTPRSPQDIKLLLLDFQGSDPIKGGNALVQLLDLEDLGERALFAQPLLMRTMQARRRMLQYVNARAATITPLLLKRLEEPEQFKDAELAAILLSGVPSSTHVLFELKQQLEKDFSEDFTWCGRASAEQAVKARLLALGNAGAYAGDIVEFVDHDKYLWEKLATFAFRGACTAFARGERRNGSTVARLLVQTGARDQAFPKPDISSKDIPKGAISTEEIYSEISYGAFSIRHSGAVVDHVLLNWSNENTHWRVRYLGAGIVASANFGRTVDPVDEWLQRETDSDVRHELFLALGSASSAKAADALLARYLGYQRTEGKHALSTSIWRCTDRNAAIKELESLVEENVEKFPASIISLARLGHKHPDIESYLNSKNFFLRANAALAIGYLNDKRYSGKLKSQLRESATPVERICVAAALLMIDGSSNDSTLHDELIAASNHDDLMFRIDPYFLLNYIKEAIWDAFNAVNSKETATMEAWRKEFQPLP